MATCTWHIPADHPTGAGHFPGNPIIPGALLLAETVRLIEAVLGMHAAACTIKNAKFFYPARPGDTVAVEFSMSPKNEISFQCSVGEIKVLAGTMYESVAA